MKKALLILGIAVAMGACAPEKRESTLGNAYWEVQYDHKGITGLISPRDSFKANVLSGRLDADVRFRMNEGEWQTVFKRLSEFYRPPENEPTYARKLQAGKDMVQVIDYKPGMPFSLEQTFRFHAIDHRKRESMDAVATNVPDHKTECLGRMPNPPYGGFDFLAELRAEPVSLRLIPSCRGCQFRFSQGMKLERFHPTVSRSLRKTSSAGMHFTFPSTISASRLWISSSHNRS